jgi:hypothetical protein
MTSTSRLGRFQVRRRLERGFAGDVILVFDPDYDREIALKVITSDEPEVIEAERRGAEIQEQLSREVPQIARLYERGQIDGKFYIAMEYVAGEDLVDLMHRPLPPRRALDFAIQLCTILEACARVPLRGEGRNQRVVHGDIKPQNIRIEPGDRVRLLDFGVAKSVSFTRKFTGNVFGSLPYLAPERLTDNRVSADSDLWAVSVVLYQMLTGELPYDAETDEGLKDQIRRGEIRLPASVPPPLHAILTRCLDPNPGARFPDATALKQALLEVDLVATADGAWKEAVPAKADPISLWNRLFSSVSAAPRAELRELQDRLRRMREAVPDRALHFGRAAAGLHDEVERTLQQIWISADQIYLYKERVLQLDVLAEGLSGVIREARQVEREARNLEAEIHHLDDVLTKHWFEVLSRRWATDLQKIGAEARRTAELEDDRDQVKKLQQDILFHGLVLEKLREADQMLSLLDGTAQADNLARELPKLQEQLRHEGASRSWLARLESLIRPLRNAAKQAKEPLAEFGKMTSLVKDLQAWSMRSGEWHREVDEIERRHRTMDLETKISEAESVVREAQELRERFVQRAHVLRENRLAELDQEVKMLAAIAGPQPALEERMRALRRLQVAGPEEHSVWLETLVEVRELCRSTAKSQESLLTQGLKRHVGETQERLSTLHSMILSDAVLQKAENLADEIREITRPSGNGQTLHRLRRVAEIEHNIEELYQQAFKDAEEVARQIAVLREQNEELQAEAGQTAIEMPDLSPRIAAALGASTSLGNVQQAIATLASELKTLRHEFESRSRELAGAQASEIALITELLHRIGYAFTSPAPPMPTHGGSPHEAAQAAAEGRELVQRAREAVEQAFQAQDEILRQARLVLEQDHSGVLGPDERKAAEARRVEIDRELANDGDLIRRLELRARLIETCEPLLGRLHQDQRMARERRDALKQRLERPEAADLRKFCPELTDRIAGLVYGIPESPWSWQSVQEQLGEAEGLLAHVEAHVLRLAAEELDRAVGDLWPGGGSSEDAVFAELSRCPTGSLPPWSVRQRILNAWDRHAQARGARR